MPNTAAPHPPPWPPPWLFGLTNIPFGVAGGYTSVAMPFILGRAGVSMSVIGGVSAAVLVPLSWQFLWAPALDVGLRRRSWLLLAAALGALLLAASLLLEGSGAIPAALEAITWRGIGSIAFMSYAATIFGFGGSAWLLSRYPASLVSPFALLVPVAGIAGAAVFLGERVTSYEIAGGVLVFAGLLINVFGPRLFARRAPV